MRELGAKGEVSGVGGRDGMIVFIFVDATVVVVVVVVVHVVTTYATKAKHKV